MSEWQEADIPVLIERAYTVYRTRYPHEPAWAKANQRLWNDTALDCVRKPRPRTPPTGGIEEAIAVILALGKEEWSPEPVKAAPVPSAPAEKPAKTAPKKPAKH